MPSDYVGGSMDCQKMNNRGEVVGRYYLPDGTQQAFYFDALSGSSVATNLNDIALDPLYTLPAGGWFFFAALGINDLGDIVGALSLPGQPDTRRGFILELRPDPLDTTLKPRLHLVPDGAWSRSYARHINNAGDVLGTGDSVTAYYYRPALHGMPGDANVSIVPFDCNSFYACMNNPTAQHGTQVVSWSEAYAGFVRYTLGDAAPEPLNLASSVHDIRGLSDTGNFCGYVWNYKGTKYTPFYSDGAVQLLQTGARFGQDINSGNDVLTEGGPSKPILYHGTYGALDLSQIVVAATPALQTVWTSGSANWSSLTERGIPGTDPSVAAFPGIVGSVRTDALSTTSYYWAYVLLPIPVSP